MSLMRQLWLAVIMSALIAFAGSLLISIGSAQSYLSQQLERKNIDIANSLALSITQNDKEKNLIDLQVAALFDSGFYQSISVSDSLGRVISQREQEHAESDVPAWFVKLLHVDSKPGIAEIGGSRRHYGAVQVISQNQFAYRILWNQSIDLLLWFGLVSIATGLVAMYILRSVGKSLDTVVEQAQAIGERRLKTISEPRITELKTLARAMNGMVERIWRLFNEETSRIDELRKRVNYDQLTSLPNRDYFMAHIKAHLVGTESAQCGVMLLVRLSDLNHINSLIGRAEADNLLCEVASIAIEVSQQHEDALAGRIKAGEIAVMIPGECQATPLIQRISDLLRTRLESKWPELQDAYQLGATSFDRTCNLVDILSRVDHALAMAEQQGANSNYAMEQQSRLNIMPAEQWHAQILHAVNEKEFKLVYFPVQNKHGKLLHQEAMVRMRIAEGKPVVMAGEFMPFATHFNLNSLVDLEVIRLAIWQLANSNDNLAVNISANSIANWTFRSELSKMLRAEPGVCNRLWFEVTEYGAFKNFDAFKDVCFALKGMGCHVGVEQFGHRLSEIKKITELGLDYVKLHSSLVEGIEENAGNQEFIRRFCEVVHTVGVQVIAVGVQKDADWEAMRKLGVDGVTGPVVHQP